MIRDEIHVAIRITRTTRRQSQGDNHIEHNRRQVNDQRNRHENVETVQKYRKGPPKAGAQGQEGKQILVDRHGAK